MSKYLLHKRVIFVGDRPSRKNVDPRVPFVGTKSYKILLDWIYRMDLDLNQVHVKNTFASDGSLALSFVHEDANAAMIALGKEASKRLNEIALPHFKMPHPVNTESKQQISRLLYRCKKFIYE